ncbi:nuclear receptor-binding factor 2-like [Chrysoperla carnea]|uniref:nuclear receptor-binding factor 2-like n=1 Tax=Chrysoperla carnea TaxID=189513 RepID=UPI001D0845A6|nr:nuclear receptor-binding factor 2-like [Chrysoperla carnea]
MEDAPLNKAHQEYRFAERHLRYRRFDEAINSHQKAAAYLTEAMKITTSAKAYESMQCQYDYHIKQQDIVKMKKQEYESYLKAVENHRLKITNMLLSSELDGNKHQSDHLQVAIYKTMNQADSLLGLLIQKDTDNESNQSVDNDEIDNCSNTSTTLTNNVGTKRPKGDDTVIEELRTLNTQLHSLVSQLITQLEISNKEVELLREKIRILEDEKAKSKSNQNNNLKTVVDSSNGTSPFICSPCSEISSDINSVIEELSPEKRETPPSSSENHSKT